MVSRCLPRAAEAWAGLGSSCFMHVPQFFRPHRMIASYLLIGSCGNIRRFLLCILCTSMARRIWSDGPAKRVFLLAEHHPGGEGISGVAIGLSRSEF